MTDTQLDRARAMKTEISRLEAELDLLREERNQIILELVGEGHSYRAIAAVTGVSFGRVAQLVAGD